MNALYSVAEIRTIERAALDELPVFTLMQRAGHAAASTVRNLLSNAVPETTVLVIAGPGNNGGDALEVAANLADAGCQVTILLLADPARLPADAQQAWRRVQGSNARFVDSSTFSIDMASGWSIVVDGLFGIGLARPIDGVFRRVVEQVNALACPVLALDVPSGLDADTGNIVGPDGIAIRATHTITFIADKPGLHTCFGRDYAGCIEVADLDINRRHFIEPHAWLNSVVLFANSLHPRPNNSHKGSYGDTIVIGGAHGMHGAPILAARAAAKCGAGRVIAAFIDEAPAYDSAQPELMCRLARDMDFSTATLVVGPGMGKSPAAHELLARALDAPSTIVLDADALNQLAVDDILRQKLARRTGGTLLTPHPLEAARLLATTSADIQADRLMAARELAHRLNAVVVLKGSGTVIADPNGRTVVNTTGNPALATAGAGDVLAGIAGALLAQHWPCWEAALAAVWLHGRAADALVEEGIGPIGMTASELIPAVRTVMNDQIREKVSGFRLLPAIASRRKS